MTTTMEVSETLERVENIVNMLDEICDHMDGFSSAEEAWLSRRGAVGMSATADNNLTASTVYW